MRTVEEVRKDLCAQYRDHQLDLEEFVDEMVQLGVPEDQAHAVAGYLDDPCSEIEE